MQSRSHILATDRKRKAYRLGREAHRMIRPKCSYRDPEFLDLLVGVTETHAAQRLVKAWEWGWSVSNLRASFELLPKP